MPAGFTRCRKQKRRGNNPVLRKQRFVLTAQPSVVLVRIANSRLVPQKKKNVLWILIVIRLVLYWKNADHFIPVALENVMKEVMRVPSQTNMMQNKHKIFLIAFIFFSFLFLIQPVTTKAFSFPDFKDIRSVAYYPYHNFEEFKNDVDKIKASGFNSVWLVLPWIDFEPTALPEGQRQ